MMSIIIRINIKQAIRLRYRIEQKKSEKLQTIKAAELIVVFFYLRQVMDFTGNSYATYRLKLSIVELQIWVFLFYWFNFDSTCVWVWLRNGVTARVFRLKKPAFSDN